MRRQIERGYCHLWRSLVRVGRWLTGRSGGSVARYLPAGHQFRLDRYCDRFSLAVDTTYPMEAIAWLSGIYEVETTQFLQRILREEDVFLDIGANCGALTLVAASAIARGKIYAFEPSPSVFLRLEANIAANHLDDRVKAIPLGVGRSRGRLSYAEDPCYRGNGHLIPASASEGSAIALISLDEWAQSEAIARLDAIKIDVEGMEYEVLQGSQTLLATYLPIVYFETLPIFFQQKPHDIRTLYEFLASFGYEILSPRSPYQPVPFDGPYPANSIAVHPSRRDRLISLRWVPS